MRALNPAFLLLLVAAATHVAHVACRSLAADYRGELPRTANYPDRLPGSESVLQANDTPLGRVTVTLVGTTNVTDDNALRAAVLSGIASSTDWLSVGDATAIGVVAGSALNRTTPTTSPPCGTTAPSLTYTIALVPAVLPTAAQARQLTDGAAGWIGGQLHRARLKEYRVVATDVKLDDALFAKQPAPFPQQATAASTNTLLGLLRASGVGMSLCDVGLAALRTLQRQDLVTTMEQIEQSAANGTVAAVGATKPRRFHNVANTRFPRVLPQRPDVNPAYVTVDTALPPGGVDVMDITMVIAGLTRDEALRDLDSIRGVARLGRYTRELARTPGLTAASVGPAPRDWLYNGAALESSGGISSGALAAAIVVPSVAALALATGGGMYYVRRRRRARDRAARVAALAASGFGTTGSGSGKPSELLRAIRDAAPSVRDPLARLANVEWEIDVADLQVATGDDGEEVELGSGASGRVVRGRYKKTGQDVAIKILTRCNDGGRGLEELAKEIVMLRACRHPNIVSFVGASIRDGVPPIMVVELMPRGDLFHALFNPHLSPMFTWRRVVDPDRPRLRAGINRRVALDVARGLSYLHSRGILHLDVKSVNVLLNAQMTAKLADAGAARALGDAAAATLTSPAGTLGWMAVEVMDGRASDKSDIYSLGVVLWELSTKEAPKRPLRHLDDDVAPEAVRNIIDACLSTDPADRPTAAAVVAALEALDDDGQPVVAARSTSASLEATLAKVSSMPDK